ncbi:hypothetical protein CHT97_11195 [Lacticaseibacillus chiayiensis]|nr:hypothetical protein CHT97_11195 [Lacticaseibacillus chiayiensis]
MVKLLLVGRSLPLLQQGRALKPRSLRVQSRAHHVPAPSGRRSRSLARQPTSQYPTRYAITPFFKTKFPYNACSPVWTIAKHCLE